MSEYEKLMRELKDKRCNECLGSGRCDDSALGDIYYKTWECGTCKGTGLKQGAALEGDEVRRAWSIIESMGVSRQRGKTLDNALLVLEQRLNKAYRFGSGDAP